jgi:membrane protease YdiL (CAAX protease family)
MDTLTSRPSRGKQIRRAAILFGVLVLLWVGLPLVLSAVAKGFGFSDAHLGGVSFQYLVIGLGVAALILLTMALRRVGPLGALEALGIVPISLRPVLASLVALLTMTVILLLSNHKGQLPPPVLLVAFGIIGPFAEELVFRGLLFLGLRRWALLPFWLAASLSSVFFGLVHYGQGSTLAIALAAVGVTFLGGILFCWLTERSGSLWAAFVLHSGINLIWSTFHLGENAVGGLWANIARLAAVAAAIATSLVLVRPTPSKRLEI